jgi:hypothetical protein
MKKQFTIRKLRLASFAIVLLMSANAWAQSVTIAVDASQNKRLISPNIYGKNDGLDNPSQFYKDAGLRFTRFGGGNNVSAHNWRLNLEVHPDWFNNVYTADWDVPAQKVNSNFSDMQGMFAFQLLGRVASSNQNNFPDYTYMDAHKGWNGWHQNLAGGGTPNPDANGAALVAGNINLFSKAWPADSSVAILNHWFGANGKGFDRNKFAYWSMDNEPDVWNGTHDWAMPTLISASAFMDRYIELAKKAKALYPGIKLCGPVATAEWQWHVWSNESIWINGRYYSWIEYFIKRLGDEYKATGIKLVDVVDIHNYPVYNNDTEALQGHRIYYDETYDYPGASGIRKINGGWDDSLKKEYIFKRINGWLNEQFGANHGITTGVSEWGPQSSSNTNVRSVIYASHLGTFANNGADVFTPFYWYEGMWETLHLFSRNAKKYSVSSTSSNENTVSAYSSVTENSDSLTVMVVNRDMTASRTVTINLSNFSVANGNYTTLRLSSLPSTETFVSHTQNALQTSTVAVNSNSLTITVPSLSTTAILLKKAPAVITIQNKATGMGIDGMYRYNSGAIVGQWTYSGNTAQQWIQVVEGNYFKFKNVASGLYLDGNGQTTPGSAAYQANNSTDWNLYWSKETVGAYTKFRNRNTGLYLDGMWRGSNSDLGQYTSSTGDPQLWTITTVGNGPQTVKSVTTEIASVEKAENRMSAYPNPFTSTFEIKCDKPNEILSVDVFDMLGKNVETIKGSALSNSITIGSLLQPDMYIVQVNGEGWTKSFKVIKK